VKKTAYSPVTKVDGKESVTDVPVVIPDVAVSLSNIAVPVLETHCSKLILAFDVCVIGTLKVPLLGLTTW